MITRALAWILAIGVFYGLYSGVKSWNNPWAMPMPSPAITSVLPAQPDGCLKNPACL